MGDTVAPAGPQRGFVDPRVAEEFPGLRLSWVSLAARAGPSPPVLRDRLRELSNRYRGGGVVTMRTKPIPQAFRAFFRQIGLDPDVTRIPSEAAAVQRLLDGGFRSRERIADALLVALVETGVGVWALDGARVDAGSLVLRTARSGESLGEGEGATALGAGRLVIADGERVLALLFGALAPAVRPSARTRALVLFSVGVAGVPSIYLEEALWLAGELVA